MNGDVDDLPTWVLRRFAESGWTPFVAGVGLLTARRVLKALLPDNYYFRFMNRFVQKRNGGNGKD